MAKKVSDTILQQQKARQNFLDLKKMQSGEMSPEPKPSEVAVSPKTFKEKLENYWFHFKWHTIGTVFSILVLIVLMMQCANRTSWDMKIVYFTYTPVLDEQLAPVADYFEGIAEDINGDGEVNINIVNCSISQTNYQYKQTILTKLQSMIAAEPDAMLYITDGDSQGYFEADTLKGFFDDGQIELDEDFYSATKTESFGELPQGLKIGCRRVEGTLIENDKKVKTVKKECEKIIEKLSE